MRKAPKDGALHPLDKDVNRVIASVQARVGAITPTISCRSILTTGVPPSLGRTWRNGLDHPAAAS